MVAELVALGAMGFLFLACAAAAAEGLPEQYREPFSKSYPIHQQQHQELKAFLDRLMAESEERRAAFFKPDFSGVAEYERSLTLFRERLHRMIGYPPPEAIADPKPRFDLVGRDKHADIYRVWVEVMKGVDAYGIYMVPRNLKGKAPLLIALHGGGGCPEAVCDLDTEDIYHGFGPEAVRRGYIVWAPLVLMQEPTTAEDRQALDLNTRPLGMTLVGIEVHKVAKGLEAILTARLEIDPGRVGMAGLSYGGYYTLYAMAAFPAIRTGVCSCFFPAPAIWADTSRIDPVRDSEVLFFDILNTFGPVQVAGLICPRPLMIQNGVNDTAIPIEGARREAPMVAEFYTKLGLQDRFVYFEHPRSHEFHNESIFEFFGKHLK